MIQITDIKKLTKAHFSGLGYSHVRTSELKAQCQVYEYQSNSEYSTGSITTTHPGSGAESPLTRTSEHIFQFISS